MRWFLSCYLADAEEVGINELQRAHSPASRSLLDRWLGIDTVDLDSAQLPPLRVEALRRFVCAQTEPVYFKVHEALKQPGSAAELLPDGIHNRVVYIVRDPRDVVLSSADFSAVSVDQAIAWLCDCDHYVPARELGMTTELPTSVGSWSDHLDSWTATDVLLVRYEDLHIAPLESFSRVVVHLNLAVDQGRIERAIDASRFELASKQERREGFVEAMPGRAFFAHGVAGRWRSELTAQQIETIERRHESWMRKLDYL